MAEEEEVKEDARKCNCPPIYPVVFPKIHAIPVFLSSVKNINDLHAIRYVNQSLCRQELEAKD